MGQRLGGTFQSGARPHGFLACKGPRVQGALEAGETLGASRLSVDPSGARSRGEPVVRPSPLPNGRDRTGGSRTDSRSFSSRGGKICRSHGSKPTYSRNPSSSAATLHSLPVFPCDALLPQQGLVETGQFGGEGQHVTASKPAYLLMGMIYRCAMLVKTRSYCQETNAVISMHGMIARNHLVTS